MQQCICQAITKLNVIHGVANDMPELCSIANICETVVSLLSMTPGHNRCVSVLLIVFVVKVSVALNSKEKSIKHYALQLAVS